jgi:hypothetical protein
MTNGQNWYTDLPVHLLLDDRKNVPHFTRLTSSPDMVHRNTAWLYFHMHILLECAILHLWGAFFKVGSHSGRFPSLLLNSTPPLPSGMSDEQAKSYYLEELQRRQAGPVKNIMAMLEDAGLDGRCSPFSECHCSAHCIVEAH